VTDSTKTNINIAVSWLKHFCDRQDFIPETNFTETKTCLLNELSISLSGVFPRGKTMLELRLKHIKNSSVTFCLWKLPL